MPAPQDAKAALERAVERQRMQREAAAASSNKAQNPVEESIERPDTDAEQ